MKVTAGFRSLLVVLALVLLIQVPVGLASGFSQAPGQPQASAAPDAPTIEIWYGDTQSFGALGNPQKQINILGKVWSADKLEYSLNGGPFKELSLGTASPPVVDPAWALHDETAAGNKRLVGNGDFNVEILTSALKAGSNTVQIKATSDYSGVATKDVTVNYTPNKTWPLPYTLDWNDFDDIGEVLQAGKAQIVDGQWYLYEEAGEKWLRPVYSAIGYDRIVAIGDVKWKSFDVRVPLQLEEFLLDGVGNLGLMVRWQGHHDDPDKPGQQPLTAWWESGVFGIYRHRNPDPLNPADCGSQLQMFYGHTSKFDDLDCDPRIKRNETYYFRFRVQQTGDPEDYGLYSMKVWKVSEPEPADWIFSVEDEMPDALTSGSILLVAHESDAMFGKVEINPLVDLQISTSGPGSVEVSPELVNPTDAYFRGQTIELTAVPDDPDSSVFVGWSGDLTGTDNPASLTLNKEVVKVTATFVPGYALEVTTTGQGTVITDPPGAGFPAGTQVKLTAKPALRWTFGGWQGDLVGKQNPVTITMNTNKAVEAVFVESTGHALLPLIMKRAR